MKYISFFFVIILLNSCIEQVDLDVEREEELLVVEGGITTIRGPHNIRLTRSARFGDVFQSQIIPVRDAQVSIRDQDGNVIFLTEVDEFGNYQTSESFQAINGNSYTLLIELVDGTRFQSLPECVIETPDIDSISFAYETIPTSDPLNPIEGVRIFVSVQDPFEEENYYRWSINGLHEVIANPELHLDTFGEPAPLECCDLCYREEEPDNSISILDDSDVNGGLITRNIGFIEDDGIRFRGLYQLTVTQQSLNLESFRFLDLLNEQLSIDGDIFDPPPSTLRGNIINLNNPDELVIGYFFASDVIQDSVFIAPADLNGNAQTTVIPNDCRVVQGATVERPPFWP